MSALQPCPCGQMDAKGRALSYAQCCGRYIEHWADCPAPDAQQLMRSRYSAFVLGRRDYLLGTWHASQRPAQLDLEAGVKWLGLQVRAYRVTGADTAEVEFVARWREAGRAVRLHECSEFVREVEALGTPPRWYYLRGEIFG